MPVVTSSDQYWAMDFVHDQLPSGRKFRVLTVIDKWHRLCVALQADHALTGYSVVDALNEIARERELPYAITADHGLDELQRVPGIARGRPVAIGKWVHWVPCTRRPGRRRPRHWRRIA